MTLIVTRRSECEQIGLDIAFPGKEEGASTRCVVRAVVPGSLASGLIAVGDWILRINDVACGRIEDVREALRTAASLEVEFSRQIANR